MSKILDIGCGSDKAEGSVGIDIHQFEGVDIVHNLDIFPWPIEDNTFDKIICSHVVEHIAKPREFYQEIHRISNNDALIEVSTPHFTSLDSYGDPTHLWHYASHWYGQLLKGGYLSEQTGIFELIENNVTFSKSFMNFIPKLMIKLKNISYWEKNYCYKYPARNIETILKVIK